MAEFDVFSVIEREETYQDLIKMAEENRELDKTITVHKTYDRGQSNIVSETSVSVCITPLTLCLHIFVFHSVYAETIVVYICSESIQHLMEAREFLRLRTYGDSGLLRLRLASGLLRLW